LRRRVSVTETTPEESTMENLVIALMQALCAEQVLSLAKTGKLLGIRRSQLERLLLLLGHTDSWGGMDYVAQEEQRGRPVIILTEKGRALCAQMQAAAE
jgi:metal-dependent hydrolase (beta-lactamase superfamily II)